MDREAWQATVHRVTQSETQLSDLAHTRTERQEPLMRKRPCPLRQCWWAANCPSGHDAQGHIHC